MYFSLQRLDKMSSVKGGSVGNTRLLPHVKMLVVPIIFFSLTGRLCSGANVLTEQLWLLQEWILSLLVAQCETFPSVLGSCKCIHSVARFNWKKGRIFFHALWLCGKADFRSAHLTWEVFFFNEIARAASSTKACDLTVVSSLILN